MAANSKHKYDVMEWIFNCVDSCNTSLQLLTCNKLRKSFTKMYKLDDEEYANFIQKYYLHYDHTLARIADNKLG